MEQLIRFNLLSDELSDEEFALMVSECVRLCDRKIFQSALFCALKGNPELVEPFTTVTTRIINDRKPNALGQSGQADVPNSPELDTLPSALFKSVNALHFCPLCTTSRSDIAVARSSRLCSLLPRYRVWIREHSAATSMPRSRTM